MNRRKVVSLLLASVASAPLIACEKKALTVKIIGEDSSNLQAIDRYLSEPDDGFSGRSSVEATDFTTASDKTMAAFTQGSADPDIVVGYNFDLPRYVQNHYVLDIGELKRAAGGSFDDAFESDLLPNVWRELGFYRSGHAEARAVAYPSSANTMILVYSEAVFRDAQVAAAYQARFDRPFEAPKTWPEFAEVARLVGDANPRFKGVALQGAEDGWLYYEWMNFLFGMGGAVMDKANGWDSDLTTPLTLRTVEAARAADLYLSLKPANAGDFYSVDAVEQLDLMKSHTVGMAIMWTDYIPDLAKTGGFGFAPIPGAVSMIAGGSFFVNRRTDAPAESAAVIARLLSKPVQKRLALDGLFPPTRSAFTDPEVLSKPYMPAVRASLERGVYMLEAAIDASLIRDKITQALQEAWRNGLDGAAVGLRATELIEAGRGPTGSRPAASVQSGH